MTPEAMAALILGLMLAFFCIYSLWVRITLIHDDVAKLAEAQARFALAVTNALKGKK